MSTIRRNGPVVITALVLLLYPLLPGVEASLFQASGMSVGSQLTIIFIFAILAPGHEPSDELATEVLDTVAEQLGRPLRPEHVVFVQDLPKTRNAKIMRRVIRARYLGRADLGDLSALENPEAVEQIEPVAE